MAHTYITYVSAFVAPFADISLLAFARYMPSLPVGTKSSDTDLSAEYYKLWASK